MILILGVKTHNICTKSENNFKLLTSNEREQKSAINLVWVLPALAMDNKYKPNTNMCNMKTNKITEISKNMKYKTITIQKQQYQIKM